MLVLRNIFGMENAFIAQSRKTRVKLRQILPMNKKIQIHRLPRGTQNSKRKAADDRIANLLAAELREQRLKDQLKVHSLY